MKRLLTLFLSFALLVAPLTDARTQSVTPQIGGGIGFSFDGGVSGNNKPVVQPNGDILLVDGVSFILQTDAASLVCRAGGC